MEQDYSYEREIDLKDLMFSVLYRWRMVIAAGVILAVLSGGYKAVSTYLGREDAGTVEENYQTELETYGKNAANIEREITNIRKSIEEQQEYLDESLLMNMSPYDEWQARRVLFVKTDYQIMPGMMYQNPNYIETILTAYRTALTNLEFLQEVSEEAGLEERYLEELVTVTAGNNLLTIEVKGDSRERVKGIMDAMTEGVDEAGSGIRAGIGNHTVSVVSESLGSLVDLGLQESQKTQRDRLTTLSDSLDKKMEEKENLKEPDKPSSPAVTMVKEGVKYAVIGGVIGIFIAAFISCMVFIMSDKLYSAKDLKDRFHLRILGTLPIDTGKKIKGVDRCFKKLEGRAEDKDTAAEYGLIAAGISNLIRDINNPGPLLLTGTAGKELTDTAAEGLRGEVLGAEIIPAGDMLRDERALRMLPESGGVILIERCGYSTYSDIALELEKTRDLKLPVIGCVVFE